MNRLLVNTAMLVAVLWPAMSYADVPACKKLGCPDCSCVVGHPDIKDKINPALLDIKNVLVKYGIPPEAVEISMKGYSGEEKKFQKEILPMEPQPLANAAAGILVVSGVFSVSLL